MNNSLPAENPVYPGIPQFAAKLLFIALAYYAGGRLGLAIPYVGSHITLIWLPTGIAVAALLRWGRALWPGVFLGAFLVNLSIGSTWLLAGGIAVGNTLGPLLTVWVLRRTGFNQEFERHQDFLLFGAAASLGTLMSALAGVINLSLAGLVPLTTFVSAWMAWWIGDAVGVFLAGMPLLTVTHKNLLKFWKHRIELLIWGVLACALGWAVFFGDDKDVVAPLVSLTLPMVIWAALRFGLMGTSFVVLGISLIAAAGAALGHGPFNGPVHGLFLLWSYISTLILSGLMIAILLTERGRVSDALRLESNFRKKIINSLPGIFYMVDSSGHLLRWNNNLKSMLRYSSEEIARSHPLDFFEGTDRSLVKESITKALETGEVFVEASLVAKDGAKIPYLFTGRSIDHNGERLVVGLGIDITERKRIEQQLVASELQLRSIIEAEPECVKLLAADGTVLQMNPAGLRMLGADTPEQIIGKKAQGIVVPHHRQAFVELIRRVFEGESGNLEFEAVGLKGVHCWLETHAVPMRDAQGKITAMLGITRDITERKQAETEIHSLAFYDALTHLPNRRLLMDRLNQTMALSARNGLHGAILFLDLDNFKALNDTQGHDMGDLLLIEVAQRLQGCVRKGDTVGRFGGDEFVLILEGLSSEKDEAATHAEMVGEKIRTVLGQPFQLDGIEHHCSASIGINLFFRHLGTVNELLKQADVAMYQAKQSGRNAIRFFDPVMQVVLDARSKMETALRGALSKQQLCLHYQIQVDAALQPIGAEVLLRWEHPDLGMVSPARFIPLAEETGLIIPIGLWVLETACTQIKLWEGNPLFRDLNIAVNVSAREFRQEGFVAQIKAVLDKCGINPNRLKLELTESLILNNVEDSISKMQKLKTIGVEFSMDDFGTGYSSLSYLKRLPLDQIKIDQSFVRDISTDTSDAAIVQTIIAMAETLGLKVIAEGVETEAQREFLDLRGCPAFQGYLFSKPISVQQFEQLVVKWEERKAVFL